MHEHDEISKWAERLQSAADVIDFLNHLTHQTTQEDFRRFMFAVAIKGRDFIRDCDLASSLVKALDWDIEEDAQYAVLSVLRELCRLDHLTVTLHERIVRYLVNIMQTYDKNTALQENAACCLAHLVERASSLVCSSPCLLVLSNLLTTAINTRNENTATTCMMLSSRIVRCADIAQFHLQPVLVEECMKTFRYNSMIQASGTYLLREITCTAEMSSTSTCHAVLQAMQDFPDVYAIQWYGLDTLTKSSFLPLEEDHLDRIVANTKKWLQDTSLVLLLVRLFRKVATEKRQLSKGAVALLEGFMFGLDSRNPFVLEHAWKTASLLYSSGHVPMTKMVIQNLRSKVNTKDTCALFTAIEHLQDKDGLCILQDLRHLVSGMLQDTSRVMKPEEFTVMMRVAYRISVVV